MGIKQAILDCEDLATKQVEQWGEVFYIRELRASEFQKISSYDDGSVQQLAAFIVAASVDEQGAQIFEWKDIDAVCRKGFNKIKDLAKSIAVFNGLHEESDAEKNSASDQAD